MAAGRVQGSEYDIVFVLAVRVRTPGRAQEISRQYVQTLCHGEERDLSAYNRLLDDRPHVVIRDEQSQ